MDANVSLREARGKARGDRRRTLAWWDGTAARSPGAREPARRPIPTASGSPRSCCSRRPPQAATPYFLAFVARLADGRGARRRAARGGDRRLRRPRLLFARAQPARLRQGRSPRRGGGFRATKRPCARCRASAPIPPPRSRRSPSTARPRPSTATSRASSRASSRSKTPIAQGRTAIDAAARALAPSRRAGDFAQALMDIGATDLPPAQSRLPRLPAQSADCAAFALRGAGGLSGRARPKARPERAGRRFLRPPRRRRVPRAPPAAARSARFDHRAPGHDLDRARDPDGPSARAPRSPPPGVACRAPSSRPSPTSP